MLVANSFDSWQRDSFFSAAEEVQESADILESAFRTWASAKRDGMSSKDLEELRRELQTSLGTAKWQLEEFERAVTSSYGNRCDQNSISRHQQFIVAIESQISRAEEALRKSFDEGGKEQFRWVNLNEDERDDLAMFLSGVSETPTKSSKDETTPDRESTCKKQDVDHGACGSSYSAGSNVPRKGLLSSRDETVINIGQLGQHDCIIEQSAREASATTRVNVNCESDRTRSVKRAHSFSNFGSLSISIPGEGGEEQTLVHGVEDTPKDRGSRFSKILHFRVINYINQLIRRSNGLNSKMQFTRQLQSGPSIRLIIILVVAFFLLVPYLIR